jgi:asparagine synthase (glutamine-hydrolysing)
MKDGYIAESAHWQWFARDRICYTTDDEYEEHFRMVFRQAVQRRTIPGASILAQLSGGMDSSAIVCTSDMLRREKDPAPPLLDTLSYFDDSEPNWDEKPYFELVESWRGKRGIHLDVSAQKLNLADPPASGYLLPGADGSTIHNERRLAAVLGDGRYRVMLSGIGGDELLGGVPNPAPELGEYLVTGQIQRLIREALRWSMVKRVHIYRLLLEALQCSLVSIWPMQSSSNQIIPWLAARSDRGADSRDDPWRLNPPRISSPVATDCAKSWWSILETQPHLFPRAAVRYEFRYPILDRDLVDFVMSVPPSQLFRPGRRRSLMRRSLRTIVPEPILERRRKAYVLRTPLLQIADSTDLLLQRLKASPLGDLAFVNKEMLIESVRLIREGDVALWRPLMRATYLDLWLETSMATGRLTI